MNKNKLFFGAILLIWSAVALASPLMEQWFGTGSEADQIFCKYGDGQTIKIYGNQNCPLYN